jgi:hypothetical protein
MIMIVRHPENEEKKAYLSSVWEVVRREYSIRCGILPKDVSIKVKNYELYLNKGDYFMFYDNKPELVKNLGVKLKNMGYNVYLIDRLTIGLFLIL